MYEHPDINDIAYLPSKGPDGQMGWHIEVGGLLTSTLCEFAVPLDAWVPQERYWEVGAAIMTTFREFVCVVVDCFSFSFVLSAAIM